MITEGGKLSPVDRIVSPGVFTRENDLSGIAQGIADIGGAIVAPFAKGPAFAPTLVRSVQELEEKFGVADGTYYGPYTAKEYVSEQGTATICRVGPLTGYKQKYPFVIWARKGNFERETITAGLVPEESIATVYNFPNTGTFVPGVAVFAETSGAIPSTSTGASVYLYSNVTFVADENNPYQNKTVTLGAFILTDVDITFGGSTSSDIEEAYSQSIDAGMLEIKTTVTSVATDSTGADADFQVWTPVELTISSSRLDECADSVLLVSGSMSGEFGKYTGVFTPSGESVLDPCTNTWVSSSADVRVLAVLADTQNATLDGIVAPGFSGSILYQGPDARVQSHSVFTDQTSGSISNNFAVKLKHSDSKTAYGVYEFSLDPSSQKFITNVFGTDATAGKPPTPAGQKIEAAYLYKVFENQIAMVAEDNAHYFISGSHLPTPEVRGETMDFTDEYSTKPNEGDSQFAIKSAQTPWIVSQAVSSWDGTSSPSRYRLFKVHTLSDGTSANTSYKVEISNVRLAGQVAGSDWGSFTLTVRSYSDTDKKPTILETFGNLNLDKNSSNYVARRIGDRFNYINATGKIVEFGTYENLSKYIRIEVSEAPWATVSVPAGFESFSVPVDGSMGYWVVPVRYARASIYGVEPGKYPSGVSFGDVPVGADNELSSLYPMSSTGNGTADDNKQYFAPLPSFGGESSIGRNTVFALDQSVDEWGMDAPNTTGSYLPPELNGAVPFVFDDAKREQTYVKMRKFVLGFQDGFDGQSPAIPVNIGSDIAPGNTQGLDCTTITSAGSVAYKQCVAALGNSDEFDINLIVTPGIVHEHHPYITNLVIDTCEKRGDCFYIMDLNVLPEGEAVPGGIDDVVYMAKQYDTNYAAAYYPWVKILDTNTNKIVSVPPSVVLPAVYAANDNVAAEWFAPAGLNRGGITQATQVCDRTTHEERDTLYEGKVNPIAAFPGQGICVWGQKTLQNAASALDRVNVRRLLINIKKYFASTAKYLVFEQNVAATRNKFLAIVNPYLESIQQRSGLYAFQVVMDDTNNTPDLIDRNILYGQIYLKPTKTAEFIVLDFNILPTGAQFPSA